MRALLALVVVAAAASSAHAEGNRLAVQAGVLPGISFVGVDYDRVLIPNIDIAASVSYGFTGDASLVPRMRVPFNRTSVSFGAGPSLVYDKGFFAEPAGWHWQALADFELTRVTRDDWVLLLRGGVAVSTPPMALTMTPYLGIGIGRAL